MIKLGIIIGNRGFFPAHLCDTGRKQILATLEKLGIGVVTLPKTATKFGAVESLEDAQKCADLFKQNAGKIDGILVTLPNFGDERGVANALRWSGLQRARARSRLQRRSAEHDHQGPPRSASAARCRSATTSANTTFPFTLTRLHTCRARPARASAQDLAGFCRDLPRRQGAEKPAHRRARRPAHGVQHRSLQRKIAGTVRHQHRDARPVRIVRLGRQAEGRRRGGGSQAGGNSELRCRQVHPAGRAVEDGQVRRGGGQVDEANAPQRHRHSMLDGDGGILRRRALHADEHDEQHADEQRVRGGHHGHGGDVCDGPGQRQAQRAGGLEQQLRRRPGQGRRFPLQQPAQGRVRRQRRGHAGDGLPGNHRRHGRQGKHLRHRRGPREGRAVHLPAREHRRCGGQNPRLRRRRRVDQRPAENVRRLRRGAGFRISRSCCATFARTASNITSPSTRRASPPA